MEKISSYLLSVFLVSIIIAFLKKFKVKATYLLFFLLQANILFSALSKLYLYVDEVSDRNQIFQQTSIYLHFKHHS